MHQRLTSIDLGQKPCEALKDVSSVSQNWKRWVLEEGFLGSWSSLDCPMCTGPAKGTVGGSQFALNLLCPKTWLVNNSSEKSSGFYDLAKGVDIDKGTKVHRI